MSQDSLCSNLLRHFHTIKQSDNKCFLRNRQLDAILVSEVSQRLNTKHLSETTYKHKVTSGGKDVLCWIRHRSEEEQMAPPGPPVYTWEEKIIIKLQPQSFFIQILAAVHTCMEMWIRGSKQIFSWSIIYYKWWVPTLKCSIFCQSSNCFWMFNNA